ncbi:MAG: class I SAM-dependent methyltransferase [Candidatus Brocadiia bacterium]
MDKAGLSADESCQDGRTAKTGAPVGWEPMGTALVTYSKGDFDATLSVIREDGDVARFAAKFFFRDYWALDEIERSALDMCSGRVLELGAGVGGSALYLQRKGLEVVALDCSPDCVALMKKRGVIRAVVGDAFRYEERGFDTVLSLMNGAGLFGTMAAFEDYLSRLDALLNPGGKFIFDSYDLRKVADPRERAYQAYLTGQGRYFGEYLTRLEFSGRCGEPYRTLHLDPDTLLAAVAGHGLVCRCYPRDYCGRYLAVVSRKETP